MGWKRHGGSASAFVLGLVCSLAGEAQAQTSPPAPQASPGPLATGVEEVVVTAQRRAENVQDVPLSITAVSGSSLIKSGVVTLDGLQRVAPGVTISSVGSGFVSYTYIRGGGTNQIDPGSDPSVAFFVDEIYLGGTAGLQFDLFDIDHVEVLKGPQGTLFGRNASSGAISIVTKRPSKTFDGSVDLEAGDYGTFLARGGVSGPVTPDGSLLFRASGVYRRHDAYTENLTGGADPGDLDSVGVRGQLEWVGEGKSFLLTADALRARNGQTNEFLSTSNIAGFVNPALPQGPGESFYKHYYDLVGFEDQDLYNVNGRLEWRTRLGTVTSITAFRFNNFRRLQDQDSTQYTSYALGSRERDKTVSQELRLTGSWGSKAQYVLGLFYYHADIASQFYVLAGPAFPTPVVRNTTAFDRGAITTDSYAAFGQITYDFTKWLGLTLGGRYSNDDKADDRAVKGFLAPAPFLVDPHASFNSFDPAVTLSLRPREGVLAYFSYRTGFKSGGFQTALPATAALANTPFLPEDVTSYEVGVKSTLFERRLIANASVFRSDITNQQISRLTGPATVSIDNAGATRTDGVDVSLIGKPIAPLTLSADFTVQRARFEQYQTGTISYAGNSQLRSPDFAGSFAAEYVLGLGSAGDLSFRGEYSYRSKTFFDAVNSSSHGLFQPGFGLGTARLTYQPLEKPWSAALYVKNIGDEQYFRNILISGPTGLAVPGDPRTIGVAFNYRFR